ncbi:PREDICTED: uncharacterized protein LOC106314704 [Brassica oleracea var. oleracea]|uniref:uncharacterized protein LOC106314704 n=1 Tax=Brassica oleracea var. oleracea TaxID=109376 RepID=UPI0006A6D941|nr:PREDICTED: uncharacterized protein LOC106314704 [Brassica oleracea var. oleracea]
MVDKAWVHLSRVDPAYERGASKFVRDVVATSGGIDMIVCPCIDCRNIDRHSGSVVVDHLVTRGMEESYKMRSDWYLHGDFNSGVADEGRVHQWNDEIFGLYRAAECFDAVLAGTGDFSEMAEGEDKKEDEFLAKLANTETPLYLSCANHSKLSAIVSLFRLKTQNGWSDKSFNDMLETLPEMLPEENVLHTSLYEVKKNLKSFDMGYEKIHACVSDCCLFRKRLKKLDHCPKCKASRWKTNVHIGETKKGVPQKVLRYFPIIPRLKRMYRYKVLAKDLRWHFSNKSTDGKLRHPVDSVTWDQMNAKYPTFAAEERNMRLGLSTDGFKPFNMKNTMYICWPVLLVNYNLPPDLCMKKENIMFSLLIPGPQQSGNSIDVYLEPLIEDLNHLWSIGDLVYDAVTRSTFTLKAMLLWTISGVPAYGNLAGCKNEFGNVKRSGSKRKRVVCTDIRSDTEGLSSESEEEEEEYEDVKVDEDELSRWKKRSIFFKLPFWAELPVRHNLDVMHVERNVAASLVSTLLHCGKSKDGLPARKDLEDLGIRQDLHPKIQGKRTYLPPAPWSLSKTKKKVFCRRLFDFKGPDGFCSNISRGVSLDDCKVTGLKSHDYHVLMQQLLPIALKGLLPKGPRLEITRLCAFFNLLCHRVIDMEQLLVMEAEIVETLCLFEIYFPPSFFDIMVHLTVHLGREARLGGPVHFRWMYPFERYMKVLKDFVRNTARPEGCIDESYLAEECIRFCSEFLKKTTNVEDKIERNMEYENNSILEGRPISIGTSITLTEMEKKIAHLAIIQNLALVPLDSKEHEETLKWLAYGPRCSARSYTCIIVNGQRFRTASVDRKSQNSGVYYEATAVCRSSAKDISQVVDFVSYYGRVTDIILMDYNVFYVPLFGCQWVVKGNGVKIEDGFTLVNMHHSQASFFADPYILASQAKQVFYSRENESSNWYIFMRCPSRRYSKEDVQEGAADIGPLPTNIDMDVDNDYADNARTDCE